MLLAMTMKLTTIPLPVMLHKRMKILAKARKLTIADIYLEAVTAYIEKEKSV